MLINNINQILKDIEEISNKDIIKDAIQDRLNKSLLLYMDMLDRNYDVLLDDDHKNIIKQMNKKKGGK